MIRRLKMAGFTIVEMVVAIFVMSLFLILFFQLFLTSESQRYNVIRRAAANDIAMTNLYKIVTKALIPASTTACDGTTSGSGNPNNQLLNSSANGSVIATNTTSGTTTPTWTTAVLSPESITGTSLPSGTGTVQTLKVLYPYGCAAAMPAQIISTVTYTTETVTHASYVN